VSRIVRRSLEAAGRRPVPGPDPAFADRLEARLLAVAATAPPPAEPPPQPSTSRLRRALVASGVAATVVALALLAIVTRPVPSVELIAPVGVQVAFQDGTTLEDPGGLLLPEGAVITVGPYGSARIGDTLLAPGDVATIHDGRLQVRHEPPIGIGTGPLWTATPRPTGQPVGASPTLSPHATVPAGSAGTASPVPTPVTAVGPTPAPTPVIRRPRLRVRLLEGRRVAVTWTATERARRYVLVVTMSRSGPAASPAYPGSRILGEFVVPPTPPLRYRVPAGVEEVRLMVVALRKDGSVLRRSQVVTITIPPAGDAAGSSADPVATPTPAPSPTPSPTPGP
jgi:hypothetical protein